MTPLLILSCHIYILWLDLYELFLSNILQFDNYDFIWSKYSGYTLDKYIWLKVEAHNEGEILFRLPVKYYLF